MADLVRIPDYDDAPTVYQPLPATPDTDSWIQAVGQVAKLAAHIAGTDFVPTALRDSPAAVTAAILYGREVGLPPITALTQTHVIEGRPSMSAEAMRALVFAAGHELVFTESTGAVCTIKGRRRGQQEWSTVTWTLDMARAAELAGKKNWRHWPRRMLQARATSELCEMLFPDVIHGFRSTEELEDSSEAEEPRPVGTSRVQRNTPKSAAAAVAAPRKGAAAAPPASSPQPPLPGEPGYDEPLTPQAGGAGTDSKSARNTRPDPAPTAAGGTDAGGAVAGPETAAASPVLNVDPDLVVPGVDDGSEGANPVASSEPDQPPDPQPESPPSTKAQHRMIFKQLARLGVDDDRAERLHIAGRILGRDLASFNHMSLAEAQKVIDTLARTKTKQDLWNLLDQTTIDTTGTTISDKE